MLDAAGVRIGQAGCDVLVCGDAGAFLGFPGRVSVAAGADGVAVWWRAVAEAVRARRHLLVVLGPLSAGSEVLPLLLRAVDDDPMFGTAQPRFSDAATDGIWPLPPGHAPMTGRASLRKLPETLITAEMLCAFTLIRREAVATMQREAGHATVAAALLHALCRARRLGFRNVVVNRAVIASVLDAGAVYPALSPAEAERLDARYPDAARAAAENARLPQLTLEPLLSATYRVRRTLLLDCRGLPPIHNGTSRCVLGLLDGLAALDSGWDVHVQAKAEAAAFHSLAARYPGLVHHTGRHLTGHYAVILVPHQPWDVEMVADLHRHGLVIGFNILDSIGWDVIYPAPLGLERGYRFAVRHVDVLTYISGFTRDRFRRRFRVAEGVSEGVVHLSLRPGEQVLPEMVGMPTAEHVLLFGNSYDHKGVEPAISLLASAFPLQHFVVVGAESAAARNVRAIAGGSAAPDEVHRLIATARAIVYPSYYEGFGLPVVEGLAYGRTVLVRSCALWTEIAAHGRFDGRLIEFDDDISLMERLGEVLADEGAPGLRFGGALGADEAVWGWRDAAAALLRIVGMRLDEGDLRHWWDRAEGLALAVDRFT